LLSTAGRGPDRYLTTWRELIAPIDTAVIADRSDGTVSVGWAVGCFVSPFGEDLLGNTATRKVVLQLCRTATKQILTRFAANAKATAPTANFSTTPTTRKVPTDDGHL
jgi:hypothetical protein